MLAFRAFVLDRVRKASFSNLAAAAAAARGASLLAEVVGQAGPVSAPGSLLSTLPNRLPQVSPSRRLVPLPDGGVGMLDTAPITVGGGSGRGSGWWEWWFGPAGSVSDPTRRYSGGGGGGFHARSIRRKMDAIHFLPREFRIADNRKSGGSTAQRPMPDVVPIAITYAIRGAPTRVNAHPVATGIRNGSATLEPAPLARILSNEPALIEYLRACVTQWNAEAQRQRAAAVAAGAFPSRPLVVATLRAVDFATLPFGAQIAVAQATDVLVGPHGAVFAHTMYLRAEPVAGIVEMKPPERRSGNFQFRNLAGMLGHRYQPIPIRSGFVDNFDAVALALKTVAAEVYRVRLAAQEADGAPFGGGDGDNSGSYAFRAPFTDERVLID
ncbi:hypothetical protein DFJ73DRAFT_872434 [Zopfochytrium polystomum]|nr:hypothetical protein DFJ73DRAFT_872434 [Zopfochytrium polystomum]